MERWKMDLARKAFDAFTRGDVEAFLAVTDPEIEFFALTGEVVDTAGAHWESGAYWGHEGIRSFFGDVKRIWEELEAIPSEFRGIGETLLVLGRLKGRSRDGTSLDMPAFWVGKVRRGRISYWGAYTDRTEAFEAAGLTAKNV